MGVDESVKERELLDENLAPHCRHKLTKCFGSFRILSPISA